MKANSNLLVFKKNLSYITWKNKKLDLIVLKTSVIDIRLYFQIKYHPIYLDKFCYRHNPNNRGVRLNQ